MICNRISFSNWRNIESETVSFERGVNVLYGANAQGKSNILEGIYFFARAKSFRGASSRELIRSGESSSCLSLVYERETRQAPTELTVNIPLSGKKQIARNKAPLTGVSELIGNFRAVLFCPDHLSLVSGGPAVRRSFMDIALAQLYPAYLGSLARYCRVLDERNRALKNCASGVPSGDILWDVYAQQLCQYGEQIAAYRSRYMELLSEKVSRFFYQMTGEREVPSLIYSTNMSDKTHVSLTDNLEREVRYGATLYGTHRDDIIIKLSGRDAKLYASQGQKRSLALAMKLAEGEIACEIDGEYPVMLLDDVLSELDGERRRFVMSELDCRQVIVTSCEPGEFKDGVNMIRVSKGRAQSMGCEVSSCEPDGGNAAK